MCILMIVLAITSQDHTSQGSIRGQAYQGRVRTPLSGSRAGALAGRGAEPREAIFWL